MFSVGIVVCKECETKRPSGHIPCENCGGTIFVGKTVQCTAEEALLEALHGHAEMILAREERYEHTADKK